ncbi:MAG: hypothetical protein J6D08_04415 [Lachnospiraceae bacterium]|nr:hypothetical protein [Lachnospiraceae bacterium]
MISVLLYTDAIIDIRENSVELFSLAKRRKEAMQRLRRLTTTQQMAKQAVLIPINYKWSAHQCIVSLISGKTPQNHFSLTRRLNEAMRWHR